MNTSVPTPAPARKSHWPLGQRPWRQPQRRPTPAGEHYLQGFIADKIKDGQRRMGANRRVYDAMRAARDAVTLDCQDDRINLGHHTTLELFKRTMDDFGSRRPRSATGTSVGVLAEFGIERGPHAAAAALRRAHKVAPWLVSRINRVCWGIDVARLKDLSHDALDVLFAREMAPQAVLDPATDSDGHPLKCEVVHIASDGHIGNAHAVAGPEYSAAEGQVFEIGQPTGLGCASPAPAENANPSPNAPAPGTVDALLTSSGWLQAVPGHARIQQAAALAHEQGPLDLVSPTPIAAARARLNLRDSTGQARPAGHREVAAFARGLQALQLRGLVDADFNPPHSSRHLWLTILGVRPRPGRDRPSAAQARYLARCGIDPTGLSRAEAQALGGALAKRREAVMAHPRQLSRLITTCGWADRLAAACASGVIETGLAGTLEWLRGMSMSSILGLAHARRRMVQ